MTGAMQECAERYRQGLYDYSHPVDAVRLAVAATWPDFRERFRWHPERVFVAKLLRGARKIAQSEAYLVEVEPREPEPYDIDARGEL